MQAKWRSSFTIISVVLPILGHLIVPDCFCPGRGTQTCNSRTVPVILGQLVTLREGGKKRQRVRRREGGRRYRRTDRETLTTVTTGHIYTELRCGLKFHSAVNVSWYQTCALQHNTSNYTCLTANCWNTQNKISIWCIISLKYFHYSTPEIQHQQICSHYKHIYHLLYHQNHLHEVEWCKNWPLSALSLGTRIWDTAA